MGRPWGVQPGLAEERYFGGLELLGWGAGHHELGMQWDWVPAARGSGGVGKQGLHDHSIP